MKLSALALDYDGTIAIDGVLDPAVRTAIAYVRQRGVRVILVTGRRLDDLRRAAGDLTTFDVVVCENGAVLDFPTSGRHVMLAHPPYPTFLAELRRLNVDFVAGESVVEADAGTAQTLLQTIRALELPLVIAFNRGRLMVLPQAVAKSTGLRQALRALRVSVHNTIGIGDAENDHDLLDSCEVGVAVEWGSAALRAVADEIIRGSGPSAVAEYIRRVSQQPRLSTTQMGRRRLFLGYEHSGAPVNLAIRGRTILAAGEPGTGKSCLPGLICEQLILQGYCVCIVDPEGDYRSLEALPNVTILGGEDPPPSARELARAFEHPDVSVVIDLSRLGHHEKIEYVKTLMPFLIALRRRTGLPHKILLDEAHYFLDASDHVRLVDPELAGYIVVTYRVSALDPAIRMTGDAVAMVTRETDPQEINTLLDMCRPRNGGGVSSTILRDLQPNEAALLPGAQEAHGTIRRFQVAPRLTAHVRHRNKYLDMPVLDGHAFAFGDDGSPGSRARTLKEFVGFLATLSSARLHGHLRRHDFSRWINDVFRDRPLASHVRGLEARLETDSERDIAAAVCQAIRARYETEMEAA